MNSRTQSLIALRSQRTRFAGRLLGLVAIPALLTALGCGNNAMRDGFAEVYGTVTLDGEPLPDAQVVFETGKGKSYGRTNRNGAYVAEYSRGLMGAGKGPAKVRIKTNVVFPDEDTSSLEYDSAADDYRKPEQVPPKYNAQSELTVEITDEGAPYDFPLTSASK